MRDMKTVVEAQSLYKTGYTVAEISRKLKKSSSNVSRWCRKAVDGDTSREPTPQDIKRKAWFDFDSVDIGSLTINKARMFLSFLYWCEGAKYPSSNRVDFVCSDVNLVITFLFLFRKSFKLDESKFRIKLQIHNDQDFSETAIYWSDKLKIPLANFTKPTVTSKMGGKYRDKYNGTCSVRYSDYSILLRIMGMYTRLSKILMSKLI